MQGNQEYTNAKGLQKELTLKTKHMQMATQITRFCSYNYFYWIGPSSPSPEPSRKRVLSSFLPICCTHTCQCGMCFGNLMERACRC